MSVGVIVPARAPAPYLGGALASVVAQDPPPEEVVVVDDASPEPLRVEPGIGERVRLIRRDERGGPAGARQAGLDALDTDLVALLDADDAWEPGRLRVGIEALERHSEAVVCFGRALIVGPDGEPTGERWEELPAGPLPASVLVPLLYERNPIPTSSVLLRRADVEEAGGFASPVRYGVEDWDLWLRLAGSGATFLSEPGVRVRYRRHPGGLTGGVAALAEASAEIHERHAGLVEEPLRRRARAADLTALARGRVRQRRYSDARAALGAAAQLEPLGGRERLLRLLLAVPGARGLLGRRDPYR